MTETIKDTTTSRGANLQVIHNIERTAERGGRVSVCIGCGGVIHDQYILRVAPDMEWHAACLKCVDCHQFLDEYCTCFVRDGKTYCKRDYVRCSACGKQLLPGDEFALREDGLYCRHDFDTFEKKANAENNNTTNINNNELKGEGKPLRKERREGKTTRVRTVLNEKQLHTLRTCYAANCRPDALMKEQLVEMTGLSPRVIRVWFQNKRCKDKKRSILMKQMQHEKVWEEKQLALQGITGVPMVASSPIRHDGAPMGVGMGGPVDVTAYQPPWKSLTEFALTHDLDRLDPSTPQYQQLVQQMHGYGAEMCAAAELLGSQPQSQSQMHQQQQPHQPQHPHGDSKYDTGPFDDSVHSDSYVSYLESDDSMTAPLSTTTSP
ncbi:insulin gene enhancer protein ISL-1-like [Homarus americanus]|uniref:insulin gene enhancer protein ISL-1-like n=1 Tax=Homarus americanus TaxID=6706 RepID=UPI001C44426A|nr:insulin gene enhancer protein ISL-1-like [Homarus americanus]